MSQENVVVRTEGKVLMGDEAKVVAARRGEGEAHWWFGALVEMKVMADDTGGQLAVVEIT